MIKNIKTIDFCKKHPYTLFILYIIIWDVIYFVVVNNLPKSFSIPSLFDIYDNTKSFRFTFFNPNFWSTSFGLTFYLISEILLVSFLFFLVSSLYNLNLHFKENLLIVVFSHSIFLLQYLSEFIFIKSDPDYFHSVSRDKFSLFSIKFFLNHFKITHFGFLDYLFQVISLFEVIYWVLLCLFFSRFSNRSHLFGIKLVFSSYIPALFLWLLIITYILLINS